MPDSAESSNWTPYKLLENTVFEIERGGGGSTVERLLWVDYVNAQIVLIDVHSKTARDYATSLQDFVDALNCGTAKPAPDPYRRLNIQDADLSKAQLRERGTRLAAMAPLISATREVRFDPNQRRAILKQIHDRSRPGEHVTKSQAYLLTRMYFQRGQRDNAFASDRQNAGYTRERRKANPPVRRPGRRYKAHSEEVQRAGVVITEQMREEMAPAIVKLRDTREANGRRPKWKDVWRDICKIYFRDHIEHISGAPVAIPRPKSACPTIKQLIGIYRGAANPATSLRSRVGEIQFNKSFRPLSGDQRDLAYGPMKLVQIDFTIADIYLRDVNHRYLMGRPTIAMIRDTFSRVIVGFSVGWQRESWVTASMALLNMVCNKAKYYRSLGIEVSPDTVASGMFETCLSDNGPLISYLTEHFRTSFNLQFDNTPSGRGDEKPVVESGFDDVNEELIYRLPGALLRTTDKREAAQIAKKAKEQAAYSLRDFTIALAKYCHYYNNRRKIEKYPISDDLTGLVAPIPMHLWHYGIEHRSGLPRQVSEDRMRVACLCRDTATVRGDGIFFRGKLYTCDRAQAEQWQVRARVSRWNIPVLYHPSNLSIIYLYPDRCGNDDDITLEACVRTHAEGDIIDISLYELEQMQISHAEFVRGVTEDEPAAFARYTADIDACTRSAKAATSNVVAIDESSSRTQGKMQVLRQKELSETNSTAHKQIPAAASSCSTAPKPKQLLDELEDDQRKLIREMYPDEEQ